MKWPGFLQPLVDLAGTGQRLDARPQRVAARNVHAPASAGPVERSIALDGRPVDYLLVRRRGRRGVGLKIDGNGMTVAASLTTPIAAIENLIGKNSGWVLKKLGEWSHRKISPQRWETGATVSFMGEPLTLMIDAGAAKTKVEQAQAHLFVHVKAALGHDLEVGRALPEDPFARGQGFGQAVRGLELVLGRGRDARALRCRGRPRTKRRRGDAHSSGSARRGSA